MIRGIKFQTKFRCFPAGYSLDLRPGINALVGDQGAGKSTLLDSLAGIHSAAVVERDAGTKFKHFDFEKYNPRTSSAFGGTVDFGVQVEVLFASHGQAVVKMLADLCKNKVTSPHTFLLDEPETGLSIRSCRVVAKFFHMLTAVGHQVIASVHNPIVILAMGEVYSVEHGQWMSSADFVNTQYEPAAERPAT